MRKILIIDDDKIFTKVLRDALKAKEDNEYEVFAAQDGEEGLEVLKKESPDLLILDVVMPKVGGVEFLERMKADPDAPDTPTLVSTQVSDVEQMSKVVQFGVRGYIIKSEFTLDDIVSQVDTFFKEEGGE